MKRLSMSVHQKRKMDMKNVFLKVALVAPVASLSLSAQAFAPYLGNFQSHYEFNGLDVSGLVAKESCGTCHVRAGGGGPRNPYGRDFDRVVLGQGKGFEAIEMNDSDGDGFLNVEEIYANTAPGSADDKPAGRVEIAVNGAEASFTPASSCGTLEIRAYGYTVAGANETKITGVSGTTKVALGGDKGLLIARCESEAFSGSFFLP
jgi:hypothetical protein